MNIKLNFIFILNSIVALIFGFGFLVFPDFLMTIIGFSDEPDGPFVCRIVGVYVLGFSILTFAVRNEVQSDARRSIIFSLFIIHILLDFLLIIYVIIEVLLITNIMIWIVLFIQTLFVVAYGYFLLHP